MSKFLKSNRPTIVGMLRSHTTSELLEEIEAVYTEGADAFGFQIEMLVPEERNEESFKRIFSAMHGLPSYVTNYARGNEIAKSDEELTETLFRAVRCGADLVDIRGDLFDRQPYEFTEDPTAIEKQKSVVRELKAMGAEVLMSSHVLKYIPSEEVLRIARAQRDRGADIAKIVTEANSEAELNENLRASILLGEQLEIPSLFLCNGTACKKHRILGPTLGSCMFLAVENSNEGLNQPTLKRAIAQLKLAGYTDLPTDGQI